MNEQAQSELSNMNRECLQKQAAALKLAHDKVTKELERARVREPSNKMQTKVLEREAEDLLQQVAKAHLLLYRREHNSSASAIPYSPRLGKNEQDKSQQDEIGVFLLVHILTFLALFGIAVAIGYIHQYLWCIGTFQFWHSMDALPFNAVEIVVGSPYNIVLLSENGDLFECESPQQNESTTCWQLIAEVPELDNDIFLQHISKPKRLPQEHVIDAIASDWQLPHERWLSQYALMDDGRLKYWRHELSYSKAVMIRGVWLLISVVVWVAMVRSSWKEHKNRQIYGVL